MKLFLISQTQNSGYFTFDSAVVAAENEDEARQINPDDDGWGVRLGAWCKSPDDVTVKHIGEAVEGIAKGVVLSSYNEG